jgi:hypothetical protein
MNERIKELVEQAEKYADFSGEPIWVEAFGAKFAELIVLKCIDQARVVQQQKFSSAPKDYQTGREFGLEVLINDLIKQWIE